MKCTNCGSKTRTIDTRQYIEPDSSFYWVSRRTKCNICNSIQKTVEVPQEIWDKIFESYNQHKP